LLPRGAILPLEERRVARMEIPLKRFEYVTWKTPAERRFWERDYERLVKLYGEGPFEIEEIHTGQNHQELVLKGPHGTIVDTRETPVRFSRSWVKRVPKR
jgi:hypothetical protein